MEAPMSDTPPPPTSIISPAARQLLDGLTALDTVVIAAGQQSGLATFHYGPRNPDVLTIIARQCLDEVRDAFDQIGEDIGLDRLQSAHFRRVVAALNALREPGTDPVSATL
jgi:hypothetical protein